jgi:hypothetical protein
MERWRWMRRMERRVRVGEAAARDGEREGEKVVSDGR